MLSETKPTLVDFGLAYDMSRTVQAVSEGDEQHGVGTPVYVAPEQLWNDPIASSKSV